MTLVHIHRGAGWAVVESDDGLRHAQYTTWNGWQFFVGSIRLFCDRQTARDWLEGRIKLSRNLQLKADRI